MMLAMAGVEMLFLYLDVLRSKLLSYTDDPTPEERLAALAQAFEIPEAYRGLARDTVPTARHIFARALAILGSSSASNSLPNHGIPKA